MLARFQDELARALYADDPAADCACEFAALFAQPAFAVYRNTVVKGCVDALQANYPSVCRLVGEEWFRAAAAIHARGNPPREPALLRYGAQFARFLESFPAAAELPYLPGVAMLDRYWAESHSAADDPVVDASEIAALDPRALAATVAHPHASARWAWFESMPIYTIWRRNRLDGDDARADDEQHGELDWHGEGALIVRPRDHVESIALEPGDCAFLDACARGEPLGEAAAAAISAQPDADLAALMARLLGAGAFGRIETDDKTLEDAA